MTEVIVCRKSDREVRTIYVDESVDVAREKYIKAALGDRQLSMGKWSIDLNENLVLSIEPTMMSVPEDVRIRNPVGPCKVVRHVGRKHPSSKGH